MFNFIKQYFEKKKQIKQEKIRKHNEWLKLPFLERYPKFKEYRKGDSLRINGGYLNDNLCFDTLVDIKENGDFVLEYKTYIAGLPKGMDGMTEWSTPRILNYVNDIDSIYNESLEWRYEWEADREKREAKEQRRRDRLNQKSVLN